MMKDELLVARGETPAHSQPPLGDKPGLSDKSGHPVAVGELLWSSTATCWPGFRLETRRLLEYAHIFNVAHDYSVVALCLAGNCTSEIRDRNSAIRFTSTPGTIFLNSRGYEYDSIRWSGSTDWLIVELDMTQVRPEAKQRVFPRRLRTAGQFYIDDRYMAALLYQMGEEARNGCPAGRLHGQSLSLTLATYIEGRYSAREPHQAPAKARLSPARMRRICDYVRANLSENLSLNDLAAALQLSPSHFSELFKNTFQLTPYQYVLRERVAEARRLLSSGTMSVVEVGHAIGYRDQSHFTNVFRKITKTTPKQYQLDCASPRR